MGNSRIWAQEVSDRQVTHDDLLSGALGVDGKQQIWEQDVSNRRGHARQITAADVA
jgi:hypothetical protein